MNDRDFCWYLENSGLVIDIGHQQSYSVIFENFVMKPNSVIKIQFSGSDVTERMGT